MAQYCGYIPYADLVDVDWWLDCLIDWPCVDGLIDWQALPEREQAWDPGRLLSARLRACHVLRRIIPLQESRLYVPLSQWLTLLSKNSLILQQIVLSF